MTCLVECFFLQVDYQGKKCSKTVVNTKYRKQTSIVSFTRNSGKYLFLRILTVTTTTLDIYVHVFTVVLVSY